MALMHSRNGQGDEMYVLSKQISGYWFLFCVFFPSKYILYIYVHCLC